MKLTFYYSICTSGSVYSPAAATEGAALVYYTLISHQITSHALIIITSSII